MVNLVPTSQMAKNARRGLELDQLQTDKSSRQKQLTAWCPFSLDTLSTLKQRDTVLANLDIHPLGRSQTCFGVVPQVTPGPNANREN